MSHAGFWRTGELCTEAVRDERGSARGSEHARALVSPDGLCVLSVPNGAGAAGATLYNIPSEVTIVREEERQEQAIKNDCDERIWEPEQLEQPSLEQEGAAATLIPALVYSSLGNVRDVTWYPLMDSRDARTCAFATASTHAPVQLWDAYTGALRATYSPLDSSSHTVSKKSAPVAIALTTESLVLATARHGVAVRRLENPGAFALVHTSQHRQPVQLSCVDANSEAAPHVVAAGTREGHVLVFDIRAGLDGCAALSLCIDGAARQGAGVTRVALDVDTATNDGWCHRVISDAGRKGDGEISCWDLRAVQSSSQSIGSLSGAARENTPLWSAVRSVPDSSLVSHIAIGSVRVGNACERMVFAGNGDGDVLAFSINDGKSTLLAETRGKPCTSVSMGAAHVLATTCGGERVATENVETASALVESTPSCVETWLAK